MITKDQIGPHPPFTDRYLAQLPSDTDIFELLQQQPEQLQHLLLNFSEETAEKGYAPGKWSVKEVIGHMMDTERIMAYRCLCVSRQETQSLPGFDENTYVEQANFNQRSLTNLLEEYDWQRKANLAMFRNLSPDMLNRIGTANNHPITAQALVAIIAAHELHHLNLLKERYLPVLTNR